LGSPRAVGRPELDIENVDAIARVMGAERPCAIVNAAAVGLVDEAERNPERALALNRDGAARLAAAAAHSGIPFLQISADFVFDGSKRTPYVEDDPAAPANIYGRSKLAGEQAVLAAHPSALVLRTAWVYGRHGTNFLTTMLRLAETQDVVRINMAAQPPAPIWRGRSSTSRRGARRRRARRAASISSPVPARRRGAVWPKPSLLAGRGAGIACRASSRFRWPSGQARRNVRLTRRSTAARSSAFSASGCRPGRSRWIVASTPSTEQEPRSRNGCADGPVRRPVISRFRRCLPRPAGADMTMAPHAQFSGA
jgi:hypothetical protein